jgi:hypothetical protein
MFIVAITTGLEFEKALLPNASRRTFMPIPLYGFMQGDTLGLIILAEESDTIQTLARKLKDAASIRVAGSDQGQVVYQGRVIDPTLTVALAGLQALDRFDVISGSSHEPS